MSKNHPKSPWTVERIEQLRVMWGKGISAGIIGAEMGLSRRAVVGKVYRLKLDKRATLVKKQRAGMRDMRPSRRVSNPVGPNGFHVKSTAVRRPMPDAEVVPLHVSLEDLERRHCRWPYGESLPYTFCGCAKIDKGPYCYGHSELSKGVSLRQRVAA